MQLAGVSGHASVRASQRNLVSEDIDFVLRFGEELHNGGAVFFFLGNKSIPDDFRADDRYAKLEGTTLVVSKDCDYLITVYRNKRGLREIKKKLKRCIPYYRAA